MNMRVTFSVAATLILTACADQVREEQNVGEPAAEVAPADDPVAVNTDTVTFIREGRTLNYAGREWMLAGDPVLRPIVTHVGTAEGIELYRTVSDQATSTTLFFYLGNGRWQALEETGSEVHINPDTMPPAP